MSAKSKKILLLCLNIWILLPFVCICCILGFGTEVAVLPPLCMLLLLPSDRFEMEAMPKLILFVVLFVVMMNAFLLYFINRSENMYKYFPGCPEKYRHKAQVTFDMSAPGKLCCSFELPGFHGDKLAEVAGVHYNEAEKLMVCI